jgi:hypothetical protein
VTDLLERLPDPLSDLARHGSTTLAFRSRITARLR